MNLGVRLERAVAVSPRPGSAARWPVVILLFAAVVINYVDRGNLSISAVPLMHDLGISPVGMGALLSAFFWTYALFQIPCGYMADRFGLKWSYAAGFALWSLASAGIGFSRSLEQVLGLRLLLGLAEAVAIPAGMAYIRRNFEPHEQALPTGIFASGAMIGPALGAFLGALLLGRLGWRPIFLLTGFGSLVWLVPWFLFAPSSPAPLKPALQVAPAAKIPWGFLLRSPLTAAITLGVFFYQYSFYFCLTWMPAYLVMARGFSFARMGVFTGLPLLVMAAVSMAGGGVMDRCTARFGNPLLVRKVFVSGGLLLATSFLCLLWVKSTAGIVATLLVSFAGIGLAGTSYWALTQLVTPVRIIGRVVGYQNTVGNIAGICAPMLTGFLVGGSKNFQVAILLAGVSLLLGSLTYAFGIREKDYLTIQAHFPPDKQVEIDRPS